MGNVRQANSQVVGINKAILNKKSETGHDQDMNRNRQLNKAWTHHRHSAGASLQKVTLTEWVI